MANTEAGRKAAQAAITAYIMSDDISQEDDLDSTVSDLVADLMHLADSHELSGEELAERGIEYYHSEVQDNLAERAERAAAGEG